MSLAADDDPHDIETAETASANMMAAVAGAEQHELEPVSPATSRKVSQGGDGAKEKEKRYKCQFCNRAFSRSEHRSRHERSRKSSRSHGGVCPSFRTRARDEVGWRGTAHVSMGTSTVQPWPRAFTDPMQTLRKDRSSARSVAAPSSEETCCCDTTVPSMPKMAVFHSKAMRRGETRAAKRRPTAAHPRSPSWTRQP